MDLTLRDAFDLAGRALFGGVLAFMGLDGFRNMEGQVAYAESKDVPKADVLVPFSHGALAFGGIGILLNRFPRLSAGAIATFMIGVTPTMHDFWNMDDEQRQSQQINFLKNLALLGSAIMFIHHEAIQAERNHDG